MRLGNALRQFLIFVVVLSPFALAAQSFDLGSGRLPLVSLDGQWRFHPGDSPMHNGTPDWAQPGFDDSGWALLHGDRSWSVQGYEGMGGYAWYRCAIRVPAGKEPNSLLLAPIMTGFRVYIDGAELGGAGNMPPSYTPNPSVSFKLFPLTTGGSSSERVIEVAVRVWHSPLWAGYFGGGFFQPGSLAGDPALLSAELRHHTAARHVKFVDQYTYSVASALIGLAILYLFLLRPVEREYLFFAIMVLAQCADCALFIVKEIWAFPAVPIFDMADGALNSIMFGANLLFISRILDAPIRRWVRFLIILLCISPFCASLYWPRWASAAESAALQLSLLLPAIVWPIYLLVRRAIQGNRDARLLLLPILAANGYYAFDNFVMLLSQAGLVRRPRFMDTPLALPPFTIHIQVLLNLVFLLAMLVFLIRRFTLARQREERLAGEFDAARQVQQVLLPDELDQCPGFHVESIYEPADQVGGDFFQQIADGHGGMLIVVGDVSGKGLPAAMVVSVLVGAIRAEAAHGADPASLLRSLNHRMLGRSHGGFVTCLAAHLSAEGVLTVANAGHLPPYLNGNDMAVDGSLPLGVLEHMDYEISIAELAPGDRLTFISDGVLEAQSRSGELLGFDRARELSRRSAATIARAAQEFGQEDDITVVTVEFTGVPCDAQEAMMPAGTSSSSAPTTSSL
jgi:phosphoserine phosphatase RsbU/P